MSAGKAPAKVLVIVPYFGSFGPWFELYLHSLAQQRTLDLLLLTDSPFAALPPNARRVEMTLPGVRDLAEARLRTPVRLPGPRKRCDLNPAYGLVFEEFTAGYEYWAFGDEDVLYGDLDRLLRLRPLRFLQSPSSPCTPDDAARRWLRPGRRGRDRTAPRGVGRCSGIGLICRTAPREMRSSCSSARKSDGHMAWQPTVGNDNLSSAVPTSAMRRELTRLGGSWLRVLVLRVTPGRGRARILGL